MFPHYPAQQLLAGIAANVTATIPGADGEPAAGLTVTVTITRADGTALYTTAAATDNGDGTYSKAMTAVDLTNLDYLGAVWQVGGITRRTTHHEIVGGYYFSAAQARNDDPNISALALDPTTFARVRGTVEAVFEDICRVAFVPRYRRHTLDGSIVTAIDLPNREIRTLREVTFVYGSSTTYTLSAGELAALGVDRNAGVIAPFNSVDSVAARMFLSGVVPYGWRNVIVGYEHGFDLPPPDLREAAYAYLREVAQRPRQSIPDRAVTFTATDGGTYRLTVPDEFSTGNPWIDAALKRYRFDDARIAF